MPHRYQQQRQIKPRFRWRCAVGLRETWREGYGLADLQRDAMAGAVVGVVALPLSMALAIASGVPPQYGLYTAIVAGLVAAIFGGTRTSITGPTAAFVVLLAPVAARYGVGGLVLASLMAGVIQILMGAARLGRLIQFIPHPVTTGFTAGIAVVIATLQFKDLLGLSLSHNPEHFAERIAALVQALPSFALADLLIGLGTLVLLVVWPRINRSVPAPLVALTVAAVAAFVVDRLVPGLGIRTIASQFTYTAADGTTGAGIPRTAPWFTLPWWLPGADGEPLGLSLGLVQALLGPALAIAMLGAIESLLCAVVADGMTGTRHDPDAELIGQGLGNVVAPFFGGFAATGAIARSATGIRAGAKSPIAAVVHSLFVLLSVLVLAPLLGYLPMSALAGLLLLVAWNMSDVRHFGHILRVAPRGDVAVLLACFGLTVVFDMVVAVAAGVVLAALLFMGRMAEITHTRLAGNGHPHLSEPLPEGVTMYEIGGPLFFGAAEKATRVIEQVLGQSRTVILYMGAVPTMDVTGLVALETIIDRLKYDGVYVVLAGIQTQPARVLERANIVDEPGRLAVYHRLDEAVAALREHAENQSTGTSGSAASVHTGPTG